MSDLTVECEDCGSLMSAEIWLANRGCPNCGEPTVRPPPELLVTPTAVQVLAPDDSGQAAAGSGQETKEGTMQNSKPRPRLGTLFCLLLSAVCLLAVSGCSCSGNACGNTQRNIPESSRNYTCGPGGCNVWDGTAQKPLAEIVPIR